MLSIMPAEMTFNGISDYTVMPQTMTLPAPASAPAQTDKEKMKEMLIRAHIVFYEEETEIGDGTNILLNTVKLPRTPVDIIRIKEGDGIRNIGYTALETKIYFDKTGKLVAWGAWE